MLYTKDGWLNFEHIAGKKTPFNIVLGGRGIGKTFSALKYALENSIVFLLLRRTQAQALLIGNPKFCPIKPVANMLDIEYEIDRGGRGQCDTIYIGDSEDKQIAGYTAALTTFVNMRGFDSSEIDMIIFDEFIPELHERSVKHEYDAFVNMYETVNRNRELTGKPPVTVYLLGNSNTLNSPILQGMKVIRKIERMYNTEQNESILPDIGLSIFICRNSPISERKAETALYRLTKGSSFADMALNNTFAYDDFENVRAMRLTPEYKLLARYDLAYIYSWRDTLYVCRTCTGVPPAEFDNNDIDRERFIRRFPNFYRLLINRAIIFADFELQVLLTKLYI